MSLDPAQAPEREQLLDEVLTAYLQAIDAGQSPDRQEWLTRHPHLAAELTEFFANQDKINRWTEPIRAAADAPSTELPAASASSDTPVPARQESPEPRLGSFGDYELLEVIARGGMGVVYKARQKSLNRLVALKMIRAGRLADEADILRFRREALAVAALNDDHIITIYQVGEEHGIPFLAMPLLEGQSVDRAIMSDAPMPVEQITRIGRDIAAGLATAHEHGILHRDIKPSNLWLEPHGADTRVKILDFGLAREERGDGQPGTYHTDEGTLLGTPAYMAPEQASAMTVDARADLYSLGAVLYQLCTGRVPFEGKNAVSVFVAQTTTEIVPVRQLNPAVPEPVADLIQKMLAKDRDQRPASARAVADRLQAIENTYQSRERERAGPARSLTVAAPVPVAAPRKPRALVAAVVALLVLGPLSYFFGGMVVRFATNKGELIVEADDSNVEIEIKQDDVVVQDRSTKREFVLSAGAGEVEVYEKASGLKLATQKFTLTRGGKEYVHVTLGPKGSQPPADTGNADRRVAEWVMSIGGGVTIRSGENERNIRAPKDLPAGAFHVVAIGLQSTRLNDSSLVHLEGLNDLAVLNLDGTSVGDNGMEHLKGLTTITYLRLEGTQVGDVGLQHLKPLTNLTRLMLARTRVSDAGLKHLQSFPNLQEIDVRDTHITFKGYEALMEAFPKTGIRWSENTKD